MSYPNNNNNNNNGNGYYNNNNNHNGYYQNDPNMNSRNRNRTRPPPPQQQQQQGYSVPPPLPPQQQQQNQYYSPIQHQQYPPTSIPPIPAPIGNGGYPTAMPPQPAYNNNSHRNSSHSSNSVQYLGIPEAVAASGPSGASTPQNRLSNPFSNAHATGDDPNVQGGPGANAVGMDPVYTVPFGNPTTTGSNSSIPPQSTSPNRQSGYFPQSQSQSQYYSKDDPTYVKTYQMNDLSNTNITDPNISNTNIPFMNNNQQQAQQQQQAAAAALPQQGYYNNLFEPYAMDADDPIDNDFTPFPVTGDAYEINAYNNDNGDEPSFEEGSTDLDESIMEAKSASILDDYYNEEDYQAPRFGDADEIVEPPPEGEMPRRSKSTNNRGIKVKMIDGNLILDCEVSQQLLSKYPNQITSQDREFKYMRYQAATCDPIDFAAAKFSLRQLCYYQPRQTEIMIVVTMYNEDDVLLARTLQGVFKNIKYLCSKTNSDTWGKDAWKKIVVCIVSDGRTKINPRSQALLAALGVYQEGFAKNMVNDKPVVGHIYEYTTMVDISKVKDGAVKLTTQKTVPVQLLFCLKEKNQKKINSHRWCFQAFAPILNPNVVVLLDAGTQPAGDSIYHLWKAFDKDASVAGACGEIKAMLNPVWYKLMWEMVRKPIVYAQNFEYKTSNILDKPMESVFGFVTVLPGAFSAYRYVALQNDVNGVGPLASYFKGETLHNTDSGLFTANMYLAEDRILCFELVAKRGCNWVLKYVKAASAKTDVPDQLPEFILQRRRWLNGSFFAAIYSLVHFFNIYHSSHSIIRLIFFHIQFFYQFISLLVSWFSLASYFLVFRILTVSLSDSSLHMAKAGNVLSVLFLWLYLASIVTTFVLSFGNKPKGTKRFYVVIVWFFAILMAYMIFAAVYMSVYAVKDILDDNGGSLTFTEALSNSNFRDLVVATASTYALYFIGALIFLDPWHMLTSFIQYILLSPAYINVLNIYAFCNIHDISWGTKGDTGVKLDLGVAKQSSSDGKFFIEIPTTNQEVDDAYTRQINILLNPEDEHESKPDPEEQEKDYYAFIRSMTVLFWMVSNFVIIALVLETGGVNQLGSDSSSSSSSVLSSNSQVFLTVILWIVAFMALFRFLGCVAYSVLRIFGK